MKPAHILVLFLILFGIGIPSHAWAQDNQLGITLGLIRTFGYGGGGRIQGTFTLRVSDADDLAAVEFRIDDQVMVRDTEPPYSHRFNTSEYPPGTHTLSAVGFRADGTELASNTYRREFITSEDAWQAARDLIIPLLIGVVGLTALSAVVPMLLGRRSQFRLGEYGLAGGAICPKCQNPFSRHLLAPNLMVGKLARCPHCRKWSIVARANPADLSAAEARFKMGETADLETSAEPADQYQKMLDDSRFDD